MSLTHLWDEGLAWMGLESHGGVDSLNVGWLFTTPHVFYSQLSLWRLWQAFESIIGNLDWIDSSLKSNNLI